MAFPPDPDDQIIDAAQRYASAEEEAFKSEKFNHKREKIAQAASRGKLDNLQERVAWLLNRYSDTRDSDKRLQIRFWDTFEGMVGTQFIAKEDFYKLTAATSITRARQKIQNTYRLFQSSEGVREHRKGMAGEEKEKAIQEQPPIETISVFADESGKTSSRLIIASVWLLHPPEEFAFLRAFVQWRKERPRFKGELHFKEINSKSIREYLEFADFLKAQSGTVSFKAISVERRGTGNIDSTLTHLQSLLLRLGIEHEDQTNRAPLPRSLNYAKDSEKEGGGDKLMLAEIRNQLSVFAETRFGGRLSLQLFEALNSKQSTFIQIADLYASSLNRIYNPQDAANEKDHFARYFLESLGTPQGPTEVICDNDMTAVFNL